GLHFSHLTVCLNVPTSLTIVTNPITITCSSTFKPQLSCTIRSTKALASRVSLPARTIILARTHAMKYGDVSLILKNVKMEDTGTYVCRVFQGQKNEHISIYLKVHLSGEFVLRVQFVSLMKLLEMCSKALLIFILFHV
uniref:Ig-like domain-containing protein n=1 Tax=Acanthochromis polyacanthus TaxID=80966 RepID=A0A3Q1H792_9TELE